MPEHMSIVVVSAPMSDQTNADYFAARAIAERRYSEVATDSRKAEAHADLAEQYEKLAREFAGERGRLHIVIGPSL